MYEARHYSKLPDSAVRCSLCPHNCVIGPGKHGLCLTRENVDGMLVSANYCRPVSTAIDPIEKKPLYHFYPGSSIFSTGPNGCNFKCGFCQNHEISQAQVNTRPFTPQAIAQMVVESGTIGIAYTYSEPTIWFETIMDVGPLVRERGLKNVMVTNGFIEQTPLRELLNVVDAMNIDIKSMRESFYKTNCKGSLAPVLAACETVKKAGCHLEITHLLIPSENDTPDETQELTDFISTHLGKDTPLHISRYFPRFRMAKPATPEELLERAYSLAASSLEYVYVGNINLQHNAGSRCPSCKALLVKRAGFSSQCTADLVPASGPEHPQPHCAACGFGLNFRL